MRSLNPLSCVSVLHQSALALSFTLSLGTFVGCIESQIPNTDPNPSTEEDVIEEDVELTTLGGSSTMITWIAKDISSRNGPWTTHEIPGPPIFGATFVTCGGCDPYQGDSKDTDNLRLLCFVPDDIQEPTAYAQIQQARWDARQDRPSIDNWRYYYGWSGGYVGLTRRVAALASSRVISSAPLPSVEEGHQACQRELNDPAARFMEFHDSGGAWGLAGMIHPNSVAPELLAEEAGEERFIVWINDQHSNPWD